MKLFVDEMFPAALAERLRARGHDVESVHDPDSEAHAGAPDEDVFAAAATSGRALVTENVADFRRLEATALADGDAAPMLVFTTNRQFPRGDKRTLGHLVAALDALMTTDPEPVGAMFLRPKPD